MPRSTPRSSRVFLLLTVLAGAWACSAGEPPDPEEQVLRELLRIDGDVPVYRVFLEGRGSQEVVNPASLDVDPGAVVVVETTDWQIHTFEFDGEALASPLLGFLEATGQMASPPLVSRGSRFVVSFREAPLGSYPYVVRGEGGVVQGVIRVREPAPSG